MSEGNDTLYGTEDDDVIYGEGGNDTLFGGEDYDELYDGDDKLYSTDGDDLSGGEGDDILHSEAGGLSWIEGNEGDDVLIGGERTFMSGGDGNDKLYSSGGNKWIEGGEGNDVIISEGGSEEGYFNYNFSSESIDRDINADRIIWGDGGNHIIYGGNTSSWITGDDGNDIITGGENDDILSGGNGNDIIRGGGGNNIFDGDFGDDEIEGNNGSDVYCYRTGSGNDTILDLNDVHSNGKTIDSLILKDLSSNDIKSVKNENDNLVIEFNGLGDSITFRNWFLSNENTNYKLEKIEFGDGTVWTTKQLEDEIIPVLEEPEYDCVIDGVDGNETHIYGKGYGKVLITEFDDKYSYGWSSDKLKLENLNPEDIVEITSNGNDLKILFTDNGSITFKDWYLESNTDGSHQGRYNRKIEELTFDDGSVWSISDIESLAKIYGTDGNDVITGTSGSDVIIGGKGDDIISDGSGNDTYIFNEGDGNDTVSDTGGNDLLKIGTESRNVVLSRITNDLNIMLKGTNDSITVSDWFASDNNVIDTIETKDATITHSLTSQLAQAMACYEDEKGISWTQAVGENRQDANDLFAAYWEEKDAVVND